MTVNKQMCKTFILFHAVAGRLSDITTISWEDIEGVVGPDAVLSEDPPVLCMGGDIGSALRTGVTYRAAAPPVATPAPLFSGRTCREVGAGLPVRLDCWGILLFVLGV